MQFVNVELKARDADPEATLASCVALGAEDRGVLEQRDTYFGRARGRLKLRDQGADGSLLIAYRRPDEAGAKESAYVLARLAEPADVREALAGALGVSVEVFKRRRLLLWRNVRIHLDEVRDLGSFVELEGVVGTGEDDLAASRERVAHVRAELGIGEDALLAGSYADLLLDQPQALLRAADEAMQRAYAPYSKFKVGAAVRGASGAIYAGANVENASYPQGWCAEPSALAALIAAGEVGITAVAVVAEQLEHCPPCGGCRQKLAEFGDAATPVYLGRPGSEPLRTSLGELLPKSFGRQELGR